MTESSTRRFSWKHLLLLHTVLEEHKLALIKKGGAEEQLTLIEDFQRAYDRFEWNSGILGILGTPYVILAFEVTPVFPHPLA